MAEVSLAAVSRAFRPGSALLPEKRVRILEAAAQLGYLSPSAQAVAALTSGSITLVAGDLENPFYPMAANALSQAIYGSGRRMVLHAVPPGRDVDAVLSQVLDFRSDAAIVSSALMSSKIAGECRRRKMPVVLFNRVQVDMRMTAVTCDNYGGGRLAAEHFVAKGRRRIAMIGGRPDTSTQIERSRGFCDLLGAAGLALVGNLAGRFQYDQAFIAARDLLLGPARPDALFCANDIMALAAMDAARELGVHIPDDVAVIGFDDIPMANWPPYRLTTIRQPLQRMVSETLDLIGAALSNPDVEGTIRIIPTTLVARDSA